MSIDDTKAILERTIPLMPDDVKDFFQQAYGDKMRMMGKERLLPFNVPSPRTPSCCKYQEKKPIPQSPE